MPNKICPQTQKDNGFLLNGNKTFQGQHLLPAGVCGYNFCAWICLHFTITPHVVVHKGKLAWPAQPLSGEFTRRPSHHPFRKKTKKMRESSNDRQALHMLRSGSKIERDHRYLTSPTHHWSSCRSADSLYPSPVMRLDQLIRRQESRVSGGIFFLFLLYANSPS